MKNKDCSTFITENEVVITPPHKLYSIEFLRVIFILAIIGGHAYQRVAGFQQRVYDFFSTKGIEYSFAVEYFFIIGGFFLYKRAVSSTSAGSQIGRTYMRLMPALLFAFLLTLTFKGAPITFLPTVLSLLGGIGVTREAYVGFGFGQWFVSAYFWASVLIIGLFSTFGKRGFLWLGILMYILYCMRAHIKIPEGYFYAYHDMITAWFARAIGSMGIGMVAGYLSAHANLPNKWPVRLGFTLLEAWALYSVYMRMMHYKECHFGYLGIQVLFAAYLISAAHSWGYISALLNRASWISYISRYSYPALCGQIVCASLTLRYANFGWSGGQITAFIICGAAVLGALEYHLVEVPVMRWMKRQRAATKAAEVEAPTAQT